MGLPEKVYVTLDGINYTCADQPDEFNDGVKVGVYKLVTMRVVQKKTTLKRPNEPTKSKGDKYHE